ncbi:MAG: hypothetical protein ACODAJ_08505 [Planctomycetota bacterium]
MEAVRRFVHAVQWRLGVGEALRLGARALCAALGVATALALAERLLSLGMSVGAAVVVPLWAALGLTVVLVLLRWPGRLTAAMRADRRLGLDERLSSALAGGHGPMAELMRADAARRVEGMDPAASFPLRWPGSARLVPLLAAVLALAVLVPELDLLGLAEARRRAAAQARGASGIGRGSGPARRDGRRRPDVEFPAVPTTETALAPDTRGAPLLGSARPGTRDEGQGDSEGAPSFVRESPRPAPSPEVTTMQESLVEARAAAEQAASSDEVPWHYRAIVKQYFSPASEPPPPEG